MPANRPDPGADRSDRLIPPRRPQDADDSPRPGRRALLLGLASALVCAGEAVASPGSLFGRAAPRASTRDAAQPLRPGGSLWDGPQNPAAARPSPSIATTGSRRIAMVNAHTGEKIDIEYMRRGRYLDGALSEFARFSRDWRENAVEPIDPKVIDIAHAVWTRLGADAPLVLLSGFRTQKTNQRLRGAARDSLHLQGKALDISHPKHPVGRLIAIAEDLKVGGVGAYRASGFVHLDSGPVRTWGA